MKASGIRSDPITLEVIHNALLAAAMEMKVDLQRTAHSPIINDGLDFSVALFNRHAETVAQAPGLPSFLCDMPTAIHSVLADIGGPEALAEGDVYLTNDPYVNTNHVHDVNVVRPIFFADELVGFAATRAHWHDIGGASGAGGFNSTEIFQEGLILRSIRLYHRGALNKDALRIMRDNNRLPDAVEGDLRSQIGACLVGERRVLEILHRYAREKFEEAVHHIFANGETQARDALAKIPSGVYEAQSCLDHDGIDVSTPLTVRARVIVTDGDMTIDLSGSSPRSRGPFNSNPNTTRSICRMIFKMLTTPDEPANEGHFRPLSVKIPSGSIFDARKPSPTMAGFFAHKVLEDVVKEALAPAIPDRVNAHDYGKCTPVHIKGWEGERFFILPDTEGGGWGGKPTGDGESALLYGDVKVVPVEVLESKYPVRLLQYRLRQDAGGPGCFRGGLGIIKDYLVLVDVRLNAGLDRQVCPPQGILGGRSALPNRVVIKGKDGEQTLPSKVTDYPIVAGEVISIQTGGGGGYGEPGFRALTAIAMDLIEGLISPRHAETAYGVNIENGRIRRGDEALRLDGPDWAVQPLQM
jgi:N-methylhydantoinase B